MSFSLLSFFTDCIHEALVLVKFRLCMCFWRAVASVHSFEGKKICTRLGQREVQRVLCLVYQIQDGWKGLIFCKKTVSLSCSTPFP